MHEFIAEWWKNWCRPMESSWYFLRVERPLWYSTPNFFDWLFLIRVHWNPKSREGHVYCLTYAYAYGGSFRSHDLPSTGLLHHISSPLLILNYLTPATQFKPPTLGLQGWHSCYCAIQMLYNHNHHILIIDKCDSRDSCNLCTLWKVLIKSRNR